MFEEGPSVDITLQWATYADASDETSLSRIYGGIHPTADDIPGRLMGYVIGPEAFAHSESYFHGELGVAPTVTITSPADGFSVAEGTAIDFAGTADDPDDGDLTAALTWTSSLDGSIGGGGAFSTTLSVGTHTITAEATDSDGMSDTDAVQVTVTSSNLTPTVTITLPADGSSHDQGTSISFAATASDIEDGDVTASLGWTSSIDGAIGGGGSFSLDTLSVGVHTITAAVTDSGGVTGSDAVGVTVNPTGVTTEVTFASVGAEDGMIVESTETSDVGGRASSVGTEGGSLRVGDFGGDPQVKTIVSFDTSSLPEGAVVTSATLRLRRGTLAGANPFDTLGVITVDLHDSGFGGDPAFAASDFEAAATHPAVATLSNALANGDWSEGTLDAAGLAALNAAGTTQFKLYFPLDDNDNGSQDSLGYYPGDNADPVNHPQLVVTYATGGPQHSVARQWNDELLDAIRTDFARPTVHARNLYHASAAMWDAWAAYDETAGQLLHREKATAGDVASARAETISYAAYRLLSWRFATSPGAATALPSFDAKMDELGYDRNLTSTAGNTPAELGNRIADDDHRLRSQTDGANEAGDYANLYYTPINPPLLAPALPGNPDLIDPEPLAAAGASTSFIDQSGNRHRGRVPGVPGPGVGAS